MRAISHALNGQESETGDGYHWPNLGCHVEGCRDHKGRASPRDKAHHAMDTITADSSALVRSPDRSGRANDRRICARYSALVGPVSLEDFLAAGATLTYSTPRLCALLITERYVTLPKSAARSFALARLRGAEAVIFATIAGV